MRPIEETGYLRIAQVSREMRSYTPEGYKKRVKVPGWRWRRWVADWCWKTLTRLRALDQFMYEVEFTTYTQEEAKAVTHAMMDDIQRVIVEYERRPDEFCIVMGGQTFREYCDWYHAHFAMMTVPLAEFGYGRGGFSADFRGTPIHVVPWLKGCAVLPKAIIVKEVNEYAKPSQEDIDRIMRAGPGPIISVPRRR